MLLGVRILRMKNLTLFECTCFQVIMPLILFGFLFGLKLAISLLSIKGH